MKNLRIKLSALVAGLVLAGLAHAYDFGPSSPPSARSSTSQSTFSEFHAIGSSGPTSCQQYYVCPGPVELCAFHPTGWYDAPNATYAFVTVKLANMPTDFANYKFNLQNADGSVTSAGDFAGAATQYNADGSITIFSTTYTHPGGYREVRAYVKRGAAGNVTFTPATSDVFQFTVRSSCSN